VRAFNISFRSDSYCLISGTGSGALFAAEIRVMTTSGTNLATAAGAKLSAFSFVTGNGPADALDGSTSTFYESKGSVRGEWLYLDLGADVPLSSIDYFQHINIVSSLRDDSVKCYMLFWKDSTNATIQINTYRTTLADYRFKPGVADYPQAAPNPRASPQPLPLQPCASECGVLCCPAAMAA
jgi:hypothetical protein